MDTHIHETDVSCIMDLMARKPKARTDGHTRVIGYIRVSTDKQADSGLGIESQRQAILAECDRKGWILDRFVQDDGLSGKNLKRPGLQEALEALAKKQVDALVSSKLDRLSRSVADFCQIVEASRRQGWTLVVLDCQVDTSTPVGEMVAGVLAQFAQFERRLIGQRTKDALAVKKSQGVVLGRRPEISPEAEATIARLRQEGATMAVIADRLNAEGVATARGGTQWYPSTVHRAIQRTNIITSNVQM